jgi:minor extracellular serine protease Vpr
VTDAGAGKLNAADAVNVAATLEPAAISFGPVPTVLPINRTLTLTNVSSAAATFSITVRQLTSDSNAHVTVSQSSVNLPAGQSQTITVSLTGSRPAPGAYEGFLDVKGRRSRPASALFLRGGQRSAVRHFPDQNGSFTGIPNDYGWRLAFRVVDQYGVPVAQTPVSFQILSGGGKFNALGRRQRDGCAGRRGRVVDLGPQQGDQIFTGTAGGLTQEFDGYHAAPAHHQQRRRGQCRAPLPGGAGIGAGIVHLDFGSDLADTTLVESTQSLPVSLGLVSVSFDGGGKSLPGHIHFVSPGQINVQIPWEFQGQSSVQMKVTLYGYLWGNLYTVPLATYSPGIFAVTDGVNNAVISAPIRPNAAAAS